MKKGLLLISGLDSILAGRVLKQQGITLDVLFFHTPFCTCSPLSSGCKIVSRLESIVTTYLSLYLTVQELGDDYLVIIKKPRFGYGKNMNPCIDCKIFMFRKARNYMKERGCDYLVTGEVLGERPMSQNKHTLKLIEREAGLEGYVVRPLSARLFPPSIPEQNGWVKREGLLSISGRSRRPQLELVEKFGIKDFPQPAGGCLLTDPGFSRRLKNFMEVKPDFKTQEVQLLKIGRHFKLNEKLYFIMGRNEGENYALESLYSPDMHLMVKPINAKGPTGIAIGDFHFQGELLTQLLASYCKSEGDRPVEIELRYRNEIKLYNILPRHKGVYANFLV
jgi:tRNA U34 2-thiouridine synthase MnmA/TrmU